MYYRIQKLVDKPGKQNIHCKKRGQICIGEKQEGTLYELDKLVQSQISNIMSILEIILEILNTNRKNINISHVFLCKETERKPAYANASDKANGAKCY